MKIWVCFVVLFGLVVTTPAEAKRKRPASAKKSAAVGSPSAKLSKIGKKSSGRKIHAFRKSASRGHSGVAIRQPAQPPVRQAAPSSDRYREIQESLAAKGYLTTPPNGLWDQNAQEALRKFQADQQLSVTGRLSSRSIIALGLGSPTSPIPPPASPQAIPPKP